jgi:hypothetical protein
MIPEHIQFRYLDVFQVYYDLVPVLVFHQFSWQVNI